MAMKKAAKRAAAAAEDSPYELKPSERDALLAYKTAQDKRAPRLKVTTGADNITGIKVDHSERGIGQIALMAAIGTTDLDFYNGLIGQLVNASKDETPSENGTNFMLSVIKGIAPRDQIEAMLAAQMAAVHMASMTLARRLANVENIPQQDSAERAFSKLTRTFAAQMSTLKDYRSKGEQKMTVQHVHVSEGQQAIVENVSNQAIGGGGREKLEEQPHALGYAAGVEMPREIEKERAAMPIARGSGGNRLSDARSRRRRSQGQQECSEAWRTGRGSRCIPKARPSPGSAGA